MEVRPDMRGTQITRSRACVSYELRNGEKMARKGGPFCPPFTAPAFRHSKELAVTPCSFPREDESPWPLMKVSELPL